VLDANALIRSLESNIQILESYKTLPERISDLLNKKEERLEQILCNIEQISQIT
jgi:hypothetical protein